MEVVGINLKSVNAGIAKIALALTEPIFFTQIIMKMAGTYTQMYVHILFAVSRKECLIKPNGRRYATLWHYCLKPWSQVGGYLAMPDHVHILIKFLGILPKHIGLGLGHWSTSKWINESGFIESQFSWQKWIWGIFL